MKTDGYSFTCMLISLVLFSYFCFCFSESFLIFGIRWRFLLVCKYRQLALGLLIKSPFHRGRMKRKVVLVLRLKEQ